MFRALFGALLPKPPVGVHSPFSREGRQAIRVRTLVNKQKPSASSARPLTLSRNITYPSQAATISKSGMYAKTNHDLLRERITKFLASIGITFSSADLTFTSVRPMEHTRFHGFNFNPVLMGYSVVYPTAVASHRFWHKVFTKEVVANKKILGVLELINNKSASWRVGVGDFQFYLVPKDQLKASHRVRQKNDQEKVIPTTKRNRF